LATLTYSRAAIEELDRLSQFLHENQPEEAEAAAGLIAEALTVLRDHPLIGRPSEDGLHELLISRGRTGYVALYRYRESTDQVTVYRIRHKREVGYED